MPVLSVLVLPINSIFLILNKPSKNLFIGLFPYPNIITPVKQLLQ